MSRRKPCRLFAHFNQAPFFFLSVLKIFRLNSFSLNIGTTLTARHHALCPSLAEARRGRFSPAGAEPVAGFLANLLHRLLLSHFSQLLARPQCFATSVVRLRCALDVFPASGDADGTTSSPTMWRTFRDLHHFSLSFLKDGALPRLSSLF